MAILAYKTPPSSRAGHCEFLEVDETGLDTSGLHTHLVSPATKNKLLSLQHRQLQLGDEDAAAALLADLQHLTPSVAKHFRSRLASQNDAVFRLINDVYFEGEEESYIAISYAWHKVGRDVPKKLTSPVGNLPFGWIQTVEQFPLPTTQGIFQAVLNERKVNEGLWFDQVCINQEDEDEKGMAISCMDVIYQNARVVMVALDDISATWDEMHFLRGYYQQYVSSNQPLSQHPNYRIDPPIMQQHPVFRSFAERVLSSIWFERAWCVHEMRMGRNLVFLVPCDIDYEEETIRTIVRFTDSFFFHMLVLAHEVVSSSASRRQIRTLLDHFADHHEHEITSAQDLDSQSAPAKREPFIPTIAEIFSLKAGGDPRLPTHLQILSANRDKTSIALNLCATPVVLTPPSPLQRPSIEDECLRSLLLLSLALRDPLALCTTGHSLRLHDNSPSWLCAPSLADAFSHTAPPAFPKTGSTLHQSSDGLADSLHLSLIFISLPHRTQPPKTFPANLDRAHSFVTLSIRHHIKGHPLFTLSRAMHPRGPAILIAFVQTLACVLECGASWLLDVLSRSHIGSESETMLSPFAAATACARLASGLLSHNDTDGCGALLAAVGTLIATGIPWASGATEVSHGPLIVSTPNSSSMGGKALFFAPFAQSRSMQVAVPDVIKGAAYSGLARGWVLTSKAEHIGAVRDEVRWVLRGKGVLFGEAAFNNGLAEGEGEGTKTPHRVYGPG